MKIIKEGNVYKRACWLDENRREIYEIVISILAGLCLYFGYLIAFN